MRTRPMAAAAIPIVAMLLAGCATAPPEPDGLTAAGVDEILDELNVTRWNALLGDDAVISRPDVERIEFIRLIAAPNRWVECLGSAGFPEAEAVGTGVYLGRADEDNGIAARMALYVCTAQYPIHPAYNGHLSQDQRSHLFDHWITRLVPCLLTLGFDIDVPDSLRDVVGIADTEWSPYDGLDPGPLGWDPIDEQCPPLDAAVYGSWRF